MPANWSGYTISMVSYLKTPKSASLDEIADKYATEYVNAVKVASTLYLSTLATDLNKTIVKNAYYQTFSELSKTKQPLNPKYTQDENLEKETIDSRNFLEDPNTSPFSYIANLTNTAWLTSTFKPIPPPGYVGATLGTKVIDTGDRAVFVKDLAKAFFIAQEVKNGEAAATLHVSYLVKAFVTHLAKFKGTFMGLISSPTGPVPGPPFPWVAIA